MQEYVSTASSNLKTTKLKTAEYESLLNKGFRSALELNDDALDTIGQRGSGGALWTFPDSEVKDMAARIFGVGGASDSKVSISLDVAGKFDLIKGKWSTRCYLGKMALTRRSQLSVYSRQFRWRRTLHTE